MYDKNLIEGSLKMEDLPFKLQDATNITTSQASNKDFLEWFIAFCFFLPNGAILRRN